jgi:hypothetical protein
MHTVFVFFSIFHGHFIFHQSPVKGYFFLFLPPPQKPEISSNYAYPKLRSLLAQHTCALLGVPHSSAEPIFLYFFWKKEMLMKDETAML